MPEQARVVAREELDPTPRERARRGELALALLAVGVLCSIVERAFQQGAVVRAVDVLQNGDVRRNLLITWARAGMLEAARPQGRRGGVAGGFVVVSFVRCCDGCGVVLVYSALIWPARRHVVELANRWCAAEHLINDNCANFERSGKRELGELRTLVGAKQKLLYKTGFSFNLPFGTRELCINDPGYVLTTPKSPVP